MLRALASSNALALPALLLALTMCSAPGPGPGGGPSGGGQGNGAGPNGSGSSGSELEPPILTTDPPPVVNPCEGAEVPEGCKLVAPPACGDGLINLEPPEPCDDGNTLPGDGCTGACVVEPYHECLTPGAPCVSTIVCGDGDLGPGEACDDKNQAAGDGCAADCKAVEVGFRCRTPGEPCVRVYLCGDGTVDPNEGCDDGGVMAGDGCDPKCRMEKGYKCEGSPSSCSKTVCGDQMVEGAESCDDGNDRPFDGCSPTCEAEPACAPGQACTSSCGDGIVLNEACDDGNLRNGDGCSSDCQTEDGFECVENGLGSCETIAGECVLRIPAVFRDFQEDTANTDFPGNCGATKNLLAPELNQSGKPEFIGSTCIKSKTTFNQWYTDNQYNKTMPGTIVLFRSEDGSYVNRLGDEGQQFISPAKDDPQNPCIEDCVPCQYTDNVLCQRQVLDGNPMFFPLDGFAGAWPDTRVAAQVPEEVYGAVGWPLQSAWAYWPADYTPAPTHNFYFSSEVQYWFRYDAAAPATLEFVGDDDMWVYVNGHLAVDLGGIHTPAAGSVTINPTTAAQFGLVDGSVYPIKMFHAERKLAGSSFKLTLSGFTTGRSDCSTNCGDGELGPGEDCDDGPLNLGGYNQCSPDCTFGPRCGDGVKQEQEVCDLGEALNKGEYGGCAPTCQLGPHCGDGLKSAEEQCDDGQNNGGYGECAPGCVLGPVCGDGGFQPEFEQCDDGNNLDQDGCSAGCKLEEVIFE